MRWIQKLAVSAPLLIAIPSCTGEQGPKGEEGAQGPAGNAGESGAQGPTGPQGAQGPAGPQGELGPKGSQGEQGAPGSAGEDGAPGAQGEPGAPAFDLRGVLVHELPVAGAEMLDVSDDGAYALVAGGEVATLLEVGRARLTSLGTLTLPTQNLPVDSTKAEFTGVSIHPSGEYALIAVKDDDDANLATFDEVPGKVIAVSLPALSVLGEVTVGRGPDSVAIAASGAFAVVANEDEEDETDLTNPQRRAGTVSVIDLRQGPQAMTQVQVPIPPAGIPYFSHDPQPETVRIAPDDSFVLATLQENNAIAKIRVPSPLPTPLTANAFSVEIFDAGVREGFGLTVGNAGSATCLASGYDLSMRQAFLSAREPDGLAITHDGRFFVTADEDNLTWVNGQTYDGIPLSPHGARSISVYDASTGAFLGDSRDTLEEAVIDLALPQRCGSKGPEPEVVDVGVILGRTIAFVALERSDAIAIHDITEPAHIRLLDVVVLNDAAVGSASSAEYEPEGLAFIPDRNLVVVSNPVAGSVSLVELRLYSSVEPRPGGPVQPPAVDDAPDVVVSEISSNPNPDWVELHNRGTSPADLSGYKLVDGGGGVHTLPPGTIVAPDDYLLIDALSIGLGASDSLALYTPDDLEIDGYSWSAHVASVSRCGTTGLVFWPTTGANGSGVPTPGAANDCTPPRVAGEEHLVINEVRSQGDDFVELYNGGTSSVDLSYFKLTDSDPGQVYVLPEGTTIEAGDYLVIEGDHTTTPPALPFGLGSADWVRLLNPYDRLLDEYAWTSHVNTASRCPDGSGDHVLGTAASKGVENVCP